MSPNSAPKILIGGKRLIVWKAFLIACPFLILVVPITENTQGSGWTFWRWTLVSIISIFPIFVVYLLADITIFAHREKRPVRSIYVFIFGFVLGAIRGISISFTAHALRLLNQDFYDQLISKTINGGLTGLLVVPIVSLFAASIDAYKFDRNTLITERMAIESRKTESQAVVKSLRASMSRKVDENLLEIVENSKEFFDEKNRNLEENWELLAEKLRDAALQTIRPFSHNLHRKGAEKQYSVKFTEILKYIAHSIAVHIPWVLLIYGVTTYTDIFMHSKITDGLQFVGIRLLLILVLMLIMRAMKERGYFRSLGSFTFLLFIVCSIFVFGSFKLQDAYRVRGISTWETIAHGLWLALIILSVGMITAFINGQQAEMEFIQDQLSNSEIEALLIQREEARIRRELAKYLHGTIQSRLMASAVNVERAGKSGDKKKLNEEVKKAYKNLTLPDDAYFSTPEESLQEEVRKVVAKWKNLINVKVKIDPKIPALATNLSQDIGSAINEALANSFRHGEATAVALTITFSKSELLVTLVDNGEGPVKGKPGLGSEAFAAISGSSWQLLKNEKGKGATLLLRIKQL